MTLHGLDISHWQPVPDYPNLAASFVFAKATESTSYVDANLAANRAGAHAAGRVFGSYHFARPGDPVIQAQFYLANGQPQAGEIAILDMEDQAIPDMAGWSTAWLQAVKAATAGTPPLIYLNKFLLGAVNWAPVVALNSGLWLADYDGQPDVQPASGAWPAVAVKQYSDQGTTSGEPATEDVDSFFGDLAHLRAYAIGGAAPTPGPPPPPPPPRPAVLGWNLLRGNYYGNIAGPAVSHGGATAWERAFVRDIQQWLIFRGCVTGLPVSAWATSGWADGVWQHATDSAMTNFHNRFYPQPRPDQCWADDYRRLVA